MEAPSDLKILFLDDDLVAVDKPEGIPVHRDKFSVWGQPACLQILRDQLSREVHPVHRLDSATSGVLLFAFSADNVTNFMNQFSERQVKKIYHAVVRGWVKNPESCKQPMKRKSVDGRSDAIVQSAETDFFPLSYLSMPWINEKFPESRYTFLRAEPLTGRYHQIRRHANYLAHPVVGDTKHGDSDHNVIWRKHRDCHRLLLHASEIRIKHPKTNLELQIQSPLPMSFARHLVELPFKDHCG
jgi:tRNA pseudouridine65 synthase